MSYKRYISYEEYGQLISKLTHILKRNIPNVKFIYGPPRGAYPIAAHLSNQLELKIIENINSLIYRPPFNSEEILLVDDVVDSGKTFLNLKNDGFVKSVTAVLFFKPKKSEVVIPDFYVEETDLWLIFPWERKDEKPNRPGYN